MRRHPREGAPIPLEEDMSGGLFNEPGGPLGALGAPPSSAEDLETALGDAGPLEAAPDPTPHEEETGGGGPPDNEEVSLLGAGEPPLLRVQEGSSYSDSTEGDNAERQLLLGSPPYSLPQQETEETEETEELSQSLQPF